MDDVSSHITPRHAMSEQPSPLLDLDSRHDWRMWLQANYHTQQRAWLIFYKKASGRPRIMYNDAVEEALCFGWIDSTARRLDEHRFAQRFTPRRNKTSYSQPNKERLRRLLANDLVMSDVRDDLAGIDLESFSSPQDVVAALKAEEEAWQNFARYSDAYQRIRLAFVDDARDNPEVFEKRLAHLIKMCKADRQFGHGIEAYY